MTDPKPETLDPRVRSILRQAAEAGMSPEQIAAQFPVGTAASVRKAMTRLAEARQAAAGEMTRSPGAADP
jgi:DNA-directed RNA polymerase specialized sigma24 family protein